MSNKLSNTIEDCATIIANAKRVVVFTGAGLLFHIFSNLVFHHVEQECLLKVV